MFVRLFDIFILFSTFIVFPLIPMPFNEDFAKRILQTNDKTATSKIYHDIFPQIHEHFVIEVLENSEI